MTATNSVITVKDVIDRYCSPTYTIVTISKCSQTITQNALHTYAQT